MVWPTRRGPLQSLCEDFRMAKVAARDALLSQATFSDGLAIHGNSSVPDSPQSHGCIRIPNSAAIEMSRQLPVGNDCADLGDSQAFVSAKSVGGSR